MEKPRAFLIKSVVDIECDICGKKIEKGKQYLYYTKKEKHYCEDCWQKVEEEWDAWLEEEERPRALKRINDFIYSTEIYYKEPIINECTLEKDDYGVFYHIENRISDFTNYLTERYEVDFEYKSLVGWGAIKHLITQQSEEVWDSSNPYKKSEKCAIKMETIYKNNLIRITENQIDSILRNATILEKIDLPKPIETGIPNVDVLEVLKKLPKVKIDEHYINYPEEFSEREKEKILEKISFYNERIQEYADFLVKTKRKYDLIRQELYEASQENMESAKRLYDLKPVAQSLPLLSKSEMESFFTNLLSNSIYPIKFNRKILVDYDKLNKRLIIEYLLPNKSDFPKEKAWKYDNDSKAFVSTMKTTTKIDSEWEKTVYSITLRSCKEVFDNDSSGIIQNITFNGWISDISPATGKVVTSCILSLNLEREEYEKIDIEFVDPQLCFKQLKGVSCAKISKITPIKPIQTITREDHRFIESKEVLQDVDDKTNLASMDWQEFEHLIRELFSREFNADGSEVKITQSSRDGGVDAVVFDSDPIRGGKIVIQAKRYTNTVGVSAVRDLFGTVLHEGAMKGILVTTSDFGQDSYEFAKDKPLSLLSGGQLLWLLGKHGYHAKIDIAEAKAIEQQS